MRIAIALFFLFSVRLEPRRTNFTFFPRCSVKVKTPKYGCEYCADCTVEAVPEAVPVPA